MSTMTCSLMMFLRIVLRARIMLLTFEWTLKKLSLSKVEDEDVKDKSHFLG